MSQHDSWLYFLAETAFLNSQIELSDEEIHWIESVPSDEEYQAQTTKQIIQCVI